MTTKTKGAVRGIESAMTRPCAGCGKSHAEAPRTRLWRTSTRTGSYLDLRPRCTPCEQLAKKQKQEVRNDNT